MQISPTNQPIPQDLSYQERFVLNIVINATNGNLNPINHEKVALWAEMGLVETDQIIKELAKKNLVKEA